MWQKQFITCHLFNYEHVCDELNRTLIYFVTLVDF